MIGIYILILTAVTYGIYRVYKHTNVIDTLGMSESDILEESEELDD